jgi:hypothetical protein
MFQDRADEYRAWAKQCLAMAARGGREEDKRTWLELADKWQRLAEEAGSRGQQAQQPQSWPGSKRN